MLVDPLGEVVVPVAVVTHRQGQQSPLRSGIRIGVRPGYLRLRELPRPVLHLFSVSGMTEQPQTNPPGRVPGGRPRTTPGLTPAVTHDAVVLVPGIMGSELYDTGTGKVLWGLAHPTWLAKAWLTKGGLAPLHLTAEEQAGDHGRIKARRLLQIPAWSPVLRGIEPYHKMTAAIENAVAHPAAVMPFPYDWRLPVEVNARRLASEAREHLERWREHPAHTAARRQAVDEREARLVFVAHSMGGLVTYAALTLGFDSDLEADTRGVMTLGTPFHGSVVAANILNTAQGAPCRCLTAALPRSPPRCPASTTSCRASSASRRASTSAA